MLFLWKGFAGLEHLKDQEESNLLMFLCEILNVLYLFGVLNIKRNSKKPQYISKADLCLEAVAGRTVRPGYSERIHRAGLLVAKKVLASPITLTAARVWADTGLSKHRLSFLSSRTCTTKAPSLLGVGFLNPFAKNTDFNMLIAGKCIPLTARIELDLTLDGDLWLYVNYFYTAIHSLLDVHCVDVSSRLFICSGIETWEWLKILIFGAKSGQTVASCDVMMELPECT